MSTLLEHADEASGSRRPTPARRGGWRREALAAAADDLETRSTAERALGLAAIELGDADAAVAHLRRAVAFAAEGGLKVRAGRGADEPRRWR